MLKKHLRAAAIAALLLLVSCTTGNENGQPLPTYGDSQDPVLSVAGVSDGATVSGTVAISAAATDNVGVTGLTLTIDGTQAATSSNGVLAHSWNTTAVSNAQHTLVFTAVDAAANSATATMTVTVDNDGGGGGGGGGGGETASVSGTVFAPNGDPVSGALVFVQNSGASAVGDPPSEPYVVYTYASTNGSFTLPGVPLGPQTLKFLKGAFSKVINLDVQAGENVLSPTQTTFSGSATDLADILVVTGNFDYIQNTLAKLGLGDTNAFGQLILGTETFDLVDGNQSLPDGDYQNFDQFFAAESNFDQYRTIFINCGNDYEDQFFADTDAMNALKAWVENGGRLYCTDWSYNFIEQLWPERIDFDSFAETGDGLSTTPEERDFAKTGDQMDELDCHCEDSNLASWMDVLGATTTGDMFHTVDWLSAWVPMDAVAGSVKTWATGTPPGDVLRPMTVTFSAGTGVVLFSSYHTEETPNPLITPQERVLQYLIFEVL